MAEAMPGPMQAPPQPTMENFAAFEQMRQEISPSEFNETMLSVAAEADPIAVAEFKSELRDLELPPEVLDVLNAMVDEILASPERYAEIRAHYKTQDMPDDLLPETFDAEFFGAFNMALDEIRMTSDMSPRAPQGFANGGVASLRPIPAAMLARHGRNGDTQLAHVTPEEMRLLKSRGGSGTINPVTGLPEFFLKAIGKVFKKIGKAIKKFASSTIGKIVIGTALFFIAGPAATAMWGTTAAPAVLMATQGFIASAGTSLLAGNNLKDSLKAGAIGAISAGAFAGITQGASAFQSTAPSVLPSGAFTGPPAATPSGVQTVDASTLATAPVDVSPEIAAQNTGAGITRAPLSGSSVPGTVSLGPRPQPGFSLGAETSQVTAPTAGSSGFSGGGVESLMPPVVATPPNFASAYAPAVTPNLAVDPNLAVNPNLAGGSSGTSQLTDEIVTEAPGFFESIKETFTPDATLRERAGSLKDAFLPGKGPSFTDVLKSQNINPMNATTSQIEVAKAIAAEGATTLARRWGPTAAIGAGVMGLMGGDQDADVPEGWENMMAGESGGRELLNKYPDRYGLKFGGVNTISTTNPYSAPNPYTTYTAATGSGPDGVATQNFPRKNGPINGPGTGTSDDVPAMLSDGEFVFTAKAVRNMGKGSRRKGAKKMYALMKKLEGAA